MQTYPQKLEATKEHYPFAEWVRLAKECGLVGYTEEECAKFSTIFDHLIEKLVALGASAPDAEKMQTFQEAVKALNTLNEENGLIETGEREELCELCDLIATEAGIDVGKYDDGIASEWREW